MTATSSHYAITDGNHVAVYTEVEDQAKFLEVLESEATAEAMSVDGYQQASQAGRELSGDEIREHAVGLVLGGEQLGLDRVERRESENARRFLAPRRSHRACRSVPRKMGRVSAATRLVSI